MAWGGSSGVNGGSRGVGRRLRVDGGVGRELWRAGEEALRWRWRRLIHRCERERERDRVGNG
jgi:hypothetical protein